MKQEPSCESIRLGQREEKRYQRTIGSMNYSDQKEEKTLKDVISAGSSNYNEIFERVNELQIKEATKFDNDKVRLDLIPPEFVTALGTILTFGAKKYAPRNWEKGMDWGRVYASLQRHLNAWWGGEKLDPETGKSHLWHAACNICFLVVYEIRGVGNDDRT